MGDRGHQHLSSRDLPILKDHNDYVNAEKGLTPKAFMHAAAQMHAGFAASTAVEQRGTSDSSQAP